MMKHRTQSALALLTLSGLSGCDRNLHYGEPTLCKQIDVIPQDESLPGDGVSSTTVDLAVCECGSEGLCADEDLVSGVTVSLSLSQTFSGKDDGQLDQDKIYLYDGRGSVEWTAPLVQEEYETQQGEDTDTTVTQGHSIRGVVTASIEPYSGTGDVVFNMPSLYPDSFELSSDSETLSADGVSSAALTLSVTGLDAGQVVSLVNSTDVGRISPAEQIVQDGVAEFTYHAPGSDALSEDTVVQLMGKLDSLSYYSNPVEIYLSTTLSSISLSPDEARIVDDSSIPFQVQGAGGTITWSSQAAGHLSCNEAPGLEDCSGESDVEIRLLSDPCEDAAAAVFMTSSADSGDTGDSQDSDEGEAGPRCSIELWVTDGANGSQDISTLYVY